MVNTKIKQLFIFHHISVDSTIILFSLLYGLIKFDV